MATLHGRGKGKSKSHPPKDKKKPSWLKLDKKKIEELIIKFHKEGKSASEIGMILRDSYGVPSIKFLTNKKTKQILIEKGFKEIKENPEDLMDLIKRTVALKKHFEKNKKDMTAKRGLQLTESKIHRLAKYYKKKKILPQTWKYKEVRV